MGGGVGRSQRRKIRLLGRAGGIENFLAPSHRSYVD